MARFDLEIRSMGAGNVDSCICSCTVLLSVFDDRESAKFVEYAAIHLNVSLVHIPLCRVAEALLNPLGEDDDDFECNWLIDRNKYVNFEIVDTCHDSCPPLKLEEPDDEKGTMYWCHPTKNGSQAPPTAVAISQHKNPFAKVLNMVHPTTPESSPPSYRLDVPKQ
ncbi:hypothetical protein CRE_18357 [Caenorhabditis remanei]|uniref:Bestrophin homolog n=1 Tax=Caenorhabditis remanei TaxID=31234 RepID=E3NT64_CAERE|nr:hypothetical protein CRE_18357 [Caenorhabditis remanei]